MFKSWYSAAWVSLAVGTAGAAWAQDGTGAADAPRCGEPHVVARGESLSILAEQLYGDRDLWVALYEANRDLLGDSPDNLQAGQTVTLPCREGQAPAEPARADAPVEEGPGEDGPPAELLEAPTRNAAALPVAPDPTGPVRVLTADDVAPFADRSLPGGGLMTEIVRAALEQSAPGAFDIHWVNDRAAHLSPLLSEGMLDIGYPWQKPDCGAAEADPRCAEFLFSDPMFEMLTLLFVDAARPVAFESDADMPGRVLCRPAGALVHDLDRADRRWLSEGLVTLARPPRVADCFDMLLAGEVDAVALNEFTGRTAIAELGLEARVSVVEGRPLAIEGLHVVVSRDHQRAEELMALVNSGLAAIRDSGRYQDILDAHMARIWARF